MEKIDRHSQKQKFEEMFSQMYPKVRAFALKILKSEEDAEDIVQEVFTKLWEFPELWIEMPDPSPYIFTMVRNSILNFLRHQSIKIQVHEEIVAKGSGLFIDSDEFYNQIYAKEIELTVRLLLNEMPEQRRRVFLKSREEGKSNQEIADELQISVRTVERHIYLVLQALKKVLLSFALLFLGAKPSGCFFLLCVGLMHVNFIFLFE